MSSLSDHHDSDYEGCQCQWGDTPTVATDDSLEGVLHVVDTLQREVAQRPIGPRGSHTARGAGGVGDVQVHDAGARTVEHERATAAVQQGACHALGSGEEQALGQGIGVRVRESKGNRLGLTIPIHSDHYSHTNLKSFQFGICTRTEARGSAFPRALDPCVLPG